jgi:hypothetical protein
MGYILPFLRFLSSFAHPHNAKLTRRRKRSEEARRAKL